MSATPKANVDTPMGFGFALTAYVLWGFLPLYMKELSHITPVEVLAHRVLWSIPVAGLVLLALGRTGDLKAALTSPKTLAMAAVTAGLISVNWGVYVWAIISDHALDAALGYYINPLFSIFLGAVLLGERLNLAKWIAISLAFAAVIVLTVDAGRLPVVALALTLTFGFYAYFKKSLPVGPNQAFLLEVLILAPPALLFVVYIGTRGEGHFAAGDAIDTGLLLGCGLVTAVPLLFYANGAKRLRLSTIGILQYIVPTMVFLIAVFIFDEPFGRARAIAFPMIWTALVIYTISLISDARAGRRRSQAMKPGQV